MTRLRAALLLLLISWMMNAATLGFFEQKFNAINFEKSKWSRSDQNACRVYTALENGAVVEVMRFGTSNQVPFKAAKNLRVTVCGSTAAFDEGFEAETPAQ